MLRSGKPREYMNAIMRNRKIVKPSAILLTTVLDHAQPAPLGAILRCELFQQDYSVRETVDGLVPNISCKVVQHEHCSTVSGEVVLDGQYLPPIAKRVLREQADF